jgi:hypothetical protein
MKKSKFKTLLKEYGYFDVDEAKKPSKYNFEQVAADYKDFEGFIDDLLPTLKKLGLYAINDPVYNGSDSYGILISKSPITKAELKAYSNEFYGDGEEEELDENFGGKNPEADKKVKRLLMQFVKELDITEGEAADLIRSSLKRIANS